MNYIQKYHDEVNKHNAKEYVGYIPYKVIPISEIAKIKFAKVIKIEVKDATFPFLWKLLNLHESEKLVKKYLNEENLKKSRFYGRVRVFHRDISIGEKVFYQNNIEKKISRELQLHPNHDFKVEMGEFVEYPKVKKESFDDIVDLSASK